MIKTTYYTDRLILRVLSSEYARPVLHFYEQNKPYLEQWEPERVANFYTETFQRVNLDYEYTQILHSQFLRLWISSKEDPGQIIGCVSFTHFMKGAFQSCMLGYKMDYNQWNKGYATEAIKKGLEIMFTSYAMHRIEAYVSPRNHASIHLLGKLGFQYEGIAYSSVRLPDGWSNHYRYSILSPLYTSPFDRDETI